MIKAVLFDFGGVLSKTGRQGFIGSIIAELYGVNLADVDIVQWHADLRRGRGNEDDPFAELDAKYGKHVSKQQFVDRITQENSPATEVFQLAADLRAAGIKTGILSNIFAMNAETLRVRGMYQGFDPVILSCEEGYAKPDPELYEIAVKRTGVPASEILFIDDQLKCLPPAEAIGMQVLLALSPLQIVADTEKLVSNQNGITFVAKNHAEVA